MAYFYIAVQVRQDRNARAFTPRPSPELVTHSIIKDSRRRFDCPAPNGGLDMFKNILDSLRDDVLSGKITLHEAAEELHESGWTNFIDEDAARRLLGL